MYQHSFENWKISWKHFSLRASCFHTISPSFFQFPRVLIENVLLVICFFITEPTLTHCQLCIQIYEQC